MRQSIQSDAHNEPAVSHAGTAVPLNKQENCSNARARSWRIAGVSADEVLGKIDAIKLRSSMTLFAHAAPREPLFREVLDRYFDGVADASTEQRL